MPTPKKSYQMFFQNVTQSHPTYATLFLLRCVIVPWSLCVKNLCVLAPLRLCVKFFVLAFAFSADYSRLSAATTPESATRRTHGSQSLHLCHFSGLGRASRVAKMSIQRMLTGFPPLISAEFMQFVQQM
jgi:hypothetical protein